jgi:hypothetical protein
MNADIREHGFIKCTKQIHGGDCGLWYFLLAVKGGGCIVAEVTLPEMRQMEDLQTATEMLDYLDIDEAFS